MRRLLFLISSSPSVFSIVYFNRVNRDFAIFRELGFSEFQAEFHAGLVELTVQITHQRIDQSAARALSHILPTPIDAPRLNAHGIRSFDCSVDNMRIIRIHHEPCFLRERDGLSIDRICFQVSNSSECVRAPSRTLSTLMHLHLITYFVAHAACSIAKECTVLYISAHPRLRLRPEIRWTSFLSHCCYE